MKPLLVLSGPAKNDSKALVEAFDQNDRDANQSLARLVPFWYATFSFSVVTGVIAVGILMWSFVQALLV